MFYLSNNILQIAHNLKSEQHFLVSSSRDLSIRVWDFNENKSTLELYGHELPITGLAILNGTEQLHRFTTKN